VNEITRDFKSLLEKRLIDLERLAPSANLIQVLLGPRQVGKTTAVQQIAKTWPGPVVFASADLPFAPDQGWITGQWQKARAHENRKTLLILDEIQKVSNWSSVVKVLIDEERQRKSGMRIVLLGSASWTIEEGLGDTLAGRFEITRAYHWTYQECVSAFGWDLNKFLKYGGYPVPAQFIDDSERWQRFILDSIIEPMLSKDILPLKQIAKPALFRQTFALAMSYPAQEIAIHKLLGQLQDRGNSTTIKNYLDMMASGYAIRLLEKYSTRPLTKKSSSPKLIPLCSALVHAFVRPALMDEDGEWFGRVFENAIGAHLCKSLSEVSYWRDGNAEVDFVVVIDKQIIAIEVKSGRRKGSSGLSEFKARFPKSRTILMDLELGEKFLLATDTRKFLLNLVDGGNDSVSN
jgi:predicted AAA+ superfamily ATPase